MNNKWIWLVGAALVVLSFVNCAEEASTQAEDDVDRNSVAPTQSQSRLNVGDVTIPQGLVSMLANGGAVAAGFLAVAALAMLIMPAFGLRMCSLIGTCDIPSYQAYSASPNSVYDYQNYGQTGTYNNPTYQKRSIEYIGPILKALGNAYDKYHKQVEKKN